MIRTVTFGVTCALAMLCYGLLEAMHLPQAAPEAFLGPLGAWFAGVAIGLIFDPEH